MIRRLIPSLLILLVAACASTPPIPEKQEAHAYESTKDDATTNSTASQDPTQGDDKTLAPKPEVVVQATGPVATVNGTDIPAEAFNKVVEMLLSRGATVPQINAMKESIANGVVSDFLIEQKVNSLDYPVPQETYNERFEELKTVLQEQAPIPDDKVAEVIAQQIGIEPEELKTQLEQAIRLEIELEKQGYLKPITKEEVEKFYNENPSLSEWPEYVTARHILIKVDEDAPEDLVKAKLKEAEAIAKEARKKGADFSKIAQEKSEGPTAQNGGKLGKITRGLMVPPFEEAVFKLKPGKVSDPVRTQFGWHVILVDDHQAARKVPLSELEHKIENRLQRLQTNDVLSQYLDDLRKQMNVELHLDNIK